MSRPFANKRVIKEVLEGITEEVPKKNPKSIPEEISPTIRSQQEKKARKITECHWFPEPSSSRVHNFLKI